MFSRNGSSLPDGQRRREVVTCRHSFYLLGCFFPFFIFFGMDTKLSLQCILTINYFNHGGHSNKPSPSALPLEYSPSTAGLSEVFFFYSQCRSTLFDPYCCSKRKNSSVRTRVRLVDCYKCTQSQGRSSFRYMYYHCIHSFLIFIFSLAVNYFFLFYKRGISSYFTQLFRFNFLLFHKERCTHMPRFKQYPQLTFM